jgi:murein L,D-transpeptidase YcbB/YkuD
MINQQGPLGSLGYKTVIGPNGVPITTATTSLNPQQQALLEQLVGSQTTAGGGASELLAGAGYGSESPSKAIGDMASGATGQLMKQETDFLHPFFDTQTFQLDAQLKNQGFTPGTPAYDNAMRQMQTNQGLQVNQFLATAFPAQQAFAKSMYEEPASLGTSLAQFGAPGSPTTGFTNALPGFTAPNTAADLATMTQAQNQQYQAQQAQYNAMISALGGIGGGIMGGPVGSAIGKNLGTAFAGGGTGGLY